MRNKQGHFQPSVSKAPLGTCKYLYVCPLKRVSGIIGGWQSVGTSCASESVCVTNANILTSSVASFLWFLTILKMVFSIVDVSFVVEREDIFLAQTRSKTCCKKEEMLIYNVKITNFIEYYFSWNDVSKNLFTQHRALMTD